MSALCSSCVSTVRKCIFQSAKPILLYVYRMRVVSCLRQKVNPESRVELSDVGLLGTGFGSSVCVSGIPSST